MSRHLPDQPSLEHLKNQARRLLQQLRQQNPDATLASAQHALAREYGFVSWRRLKAHVEALAALAAPPSPASLGFARYTESLRRVTFFSRYEAASRGSRLIESEHALLGIIRDGRCLAARVLSDAGLDADQLRAAVDRHVTAVQADLDGVHVPFSSSMRDVLRRTLTEADRVEQDAITTGHLLIALIGDKQLVSALVLREAGLRPQGVRDAVKRIAEE